MSNSKSIKLTINGKAYTSLSDIARRNNLPINTVYERYKRIREDTRIYSGGESYFLFTFI